MGTITSFTEISLSCDQQRRVLADHLALAHAQVFRRLLVKRCGLVATIVAILGMSTPLLPLVGTCVIVGMFVAAPAIAWMRELYMEARISCALAASDAGALGSDPEHGGHRDLSPSRAGVAGMQKVIKSS